MEYTVIINGQSYDLPKKTIKVVEEMDKVSKIDSVKGMGIREKFKTLFDFIQALVGKANAKEILGSDKLEDVDLSEVTLTFKKIVDAYDKPLTDYAIKKSQERLDSMNLDKVAEIVKMAEKVPQKK